MFESIKNQTPDESRKWRILLTSFLFAVLGFLAYSFVESKIEPSGQANVVTVKERVENLCQSLPIPENFRLGRKQPVGYLDRRAEVDFNFYSDYRTIEEVLPTFIMWFNENGWTQSFFNDQNGETRIQFKKNNQTITLRSKRYVTAYTATCAESELE